MKFRLESLSQGLLIAHVLEPLSKKEAQMIVDGVAKLLANGKTRIIVHFAPQTVEGEGGAEPLEKMLRPQRDLARKLGGDIKFVVPGAAGEKIANAFSSLDATIKMFLGHSEDLAKNTDQLRSELKQKTDLAQKLGQENAILASKVKELLMMVRNPITQGELVDAVAHYKKIAGEKELDTAAPGGAAPKPS